MTVPGALALSALFLMTAPTLGAQLISIKTVPIAQGDQFDIFPSQHRGMGGVSLALADTLLDPFRNPARAARLGVPRLLGSPTFYGVSDGAGGGRTLPPPSFAQRGAWYGGWARAAQGAHPPRAAPPRRPPGPARAVPRQCIGVRAGGPDARGASPGARRQFLLGAPEGGGRSRPVVPGEPGRRPIRTRRGCAPRPAQGVAGRPLARRGAALQPVRDVPGRVLRGPVLGPRHAARAAALAHGSRARAHRRLGAASPVRTPAGGVGVADRLGRDRQPDVAPQDSRLRDHEHPARPGPVARLGR